MSDEKKLLEGYRRLTEISRDLASTLELDTLLNRIVHAAADITDAKAASIMLYDETDQQLHFQVATNLDQPMMRGLVVPIEGSIAGWIVTNRKPVRTSDAHDDPRHYSNIEATTRFTTEKLLGVPLMTKEKVVGVLEVLNKVEGDFTEADEDLLTVLGAQAPSLCMNCEPHWLQSRQLLICCSVHKSRRKSMIRRSRIFTAKPSGYLRWLHPSWICPGWNPDVYSFILALSI